MTNGNKMLLICCLLFLINISAVAEIPGDPLTFQKEKMDIKERPFSKGKLAVNYWFTNESKEPIVITTVVSSCNCVKATWTKKPIFPNQKGKITILFTPVSKVFFRKRVTVRTNKPSINRVLKVQGSIT